MSTEEHINQLTAQVVALQAQLAYCSQSPPPPQPSTAPTPTPKLPKVATPTLFSGTQDDLDCFKAECSLYLSMRSAKFMDEWSSVLFILLCMKGDSAGPWVTQKINRILDTANPTETMWAEFMMELDKMFVDPNCQATARRKLATLCQGDSSVEELIQEFEIHGSTSGLGDIGLIDCFEQVIHPQLHESIYCLEPMLTTWAEWKCKASLLDNQWRHFQDTQPKAATNWMFLFCSSPAITSTAATASPSSQPSAPATSAVPQPMDLDCTHLMKRDPHHGLCFNCGKPGHIMKVC